jgi:uncharacterized damage-inducible protein DinB
MFDHPRHVFDFNVGLTIQLATEIGEDEMDQQPLPGVNPPRWILGHLCLTPDWVDATLGRPMQADPMWLKNFGTGSRAGLYEGPAPTKEDLIRRLEEARDRVHASLSAISHDDLARRRDGELLAEMFPRVGDMLCHLLTSHMGMHVGQLSAWRRMSGRTEPLF